MSRFLPYSPDQAFLLPPNVRDVLGNDHLCFWVHKVVERLDLTEFRKQYGAEGGAVYEPSLMLKVWLYAYALGVTSSRRLEQRVREDLGFRYLAGGATPDYWSLNDFRRRHPRALNDAFTQVLELAAALKMGRLGKVAIDSTKISANASRKRVDNEKGLRKERLRLRRQIRDWQKQCDGDDSQEGAGSQVPAEAVEKLERRLAEIPGRLERLKKSGLRQRSRTDPDARFVRAGRKRFLLGYSAEVAVSEDHVIVGQRVTQNTSDNGSLTAMVEAVEQQSGQRPEQVLADTGFFQARQLQHLEEQNIDAYVPDPNLASELHGGRGARGIGQHKLKNAVTERMRQKLRTETGRHIYRQRQQIVEPIFGVLKEQRGMRRFRLRTLERVSAEFCLACLAYNITRLRPH